MQFLPEDGNKTILMCISGGADSAIMLYLAAKQNKTLENPHTLVVFSVKKHDAVESRVNAIVDWINEALGVQLPYTMMYGDNDRSHDMVIHSRIIDLMATNKYDFVAVGETAVIPDPSVGGFRPNRKERSASKRVIMPFFDMLKDKTIEQYIKHDVLELLSMTHSCTEISVGRCNECYFCQERKWACDQLGITDPGKD